MPERRLHRVTWFCLGLCLSLCNRFSAQAQSPQRSADPPNIVLILADDVGREALGCYGGSSYPTPRLDQLAKEGMQLTHFFAAPVCHPTRVALISGRYLHHMQNPKWGYYPKGRAETQTLPHALRRAGYATAAAGKWHLAMLKDDPHHPSRMGFDEHCFFGWHEGPRYWKPLLWQNGAIRTRHWKLLDDGQLFDMRGDPFHEIAIPAAKDTPETAAARKKLTALLAGFPRP